MRKIGFFIALLVFTVMSGSRVLAYQTVCDPNSRWCTNSYSYKCNSTGTSYSRTYCSAGCSGSHCRCTSVSYSNWGSCYCSGSTCTQTRTIISKTPSGCSGTAALSRSCCTTSSYPTSCKSGVLYTCSQSQPNSITCTYGSCKSGTECASCNSTSGCSSDYSCISGVCVKKVNGACGTINNSCTSGTPSDVSDTSTYYVWNCLGSNGGSTKYCTLAKPVNGVCGSSNNSCISGDSSDANDTSTYYYWWCRGKNGGSDKYCSLAKPCTVGSYKCGDDGNVWYCSASPAGGSWGISSNCTAGCSTATGKAECKLASGCTLGASKCYGGNVYKCERQTNTGTNINDWNLTSTCSYGCSVDGGGNAYCDVPVTPTPATGCERTWNGVTTIFPIGSVKCGTVESLIPVADWSNQLYTCTPSGWVAKGDACASSGLGCRNPSLYADSGCSDDHLCTDQGGNCQFMVGAAGTECTIITNGQPGIIKANLCLSDKYFTYGSCCVPVDSSDGSCNGRWPGSVCVAAASCASVLQYGTVTGCSSGNVCCGDPHTPVTCDDSGFNSCGSCQECVNPGTVQSYCKSTRTSGGNGAVGGANGSKMTSISTSTSGLCSSSYGVVITDSSGSDGTFNWTCEGQTASGCRSAGNNAYGSANTCTNKPVVNGACNSNVTGLSATELCHSGTPVYSASDANHDYINDSDETEYVWGCQGSRNTCSEGDGADQLNCSSTMVQEPWFQVNDGNILSKGKVTNYVPRTTCSGNGNGCGTTVKNGAIYSKLQSSVSSYDSAVESDSSDFNFKTYTFNQLKASYFDSNGVGTTFSDNSKWSEVKNTTGLIFIDGDLEINENLVTNNFVMIIAKGTITIDYNVNEFDGILVADKVLAAAADQSVAENVGQLVIKGMVHGVNGVEFSRSLVPNDLNNTSPSVVVDYNPELLFKVPIELSKAFSQWKIN